MYALSAPPAAGAVPLPPTATMCVACGVRVRVLRGRERSAGHSTALCSVVCVVCGRSRSRFTLDSGGPVGGGVGMTSSAARARGAWGWGWGWGGCGVCHGAWSLVLVLWRGVRAVPLSPAQARAAVCGVRGSRARRGAPPRPLLCVHVALVFFPAVRAGRPPNGPGGCVGGGVPAPARCPDPESRVQVQRYTDCHRHCTMYTVPTLQHAVPQ